MTTNYDELTDTVPEILPAVSEDAEAQVNELYAHACELINDCLKVLTTIIEEEQKKHQP